MGIGSWTMGAGKCQELQPGGLPVVALSPLEQRRLYLPLPCCIWASVN
jgi:hypothetical protein